MGGSSINWGYAITMFDYQTAKGYVTWMTWIAWIGSWRLHSKWPPIRIEPCIQPYNYPSLRKTHTATS